MKHETTKHSMLVAGLLVLLAVGLLIVLAVGLLVGLLVGLIVGILVSPRAPIIQKKSKHYKTFLSTTK